METLITQQSWAGGVSLSAGIGLFYGTSGDNKPHKHWAHQLVVGLDANLDIIVDGIRHKGDGLWIPAGLSHQLGHGKVVSLYIDPTHLLCPTLRASSSLASDKSVILVHPSIAARLTSCVYQADNLQSALDAFQAHYQQSEKIEINDRLLRVLSRLKQDVIDGSNSPLNDLAGLVCLSPSRFSHWFKEQTGLPLRSYKKWLKLIVCFELSRQMPLAVAAVSAGFSDQAHFCRTVTQAFGVSSRTIMRLLT
ncbi:helix-turn-helix domain-containing protein [Ketobacter alkanivorans]|uniref:HTH araC/xylS-type domain-containing protein n=1 Tax=Ketobacter alkanivorans TaxID=1917421 RepID=A0A2K9LFR0_9GAMM|nr:helix-turn-helix domain-containing protein [Ketobacter alkanivorans]AUM11112.1 hypothetical protein Kalk_01085 [Ketobacter alkanivorans]MAR91826.1 hypothetical protein [Pseudomonadales bacterium]